MPTTARPRNLSPRLIGSGVIAASTSRGATSTPLTLTRSVRSMPSAWIVLSFSMKSAPSAYLKVTLPVSTQRGTSRTSSCSTLTHSTGPMPSGNGKSSGALNGSVVCQSPFSQTIGGFRHSSIVVQMLNTGANAKPGISRSPPSRMWTSRTSSKSCFAAWAAKTSVRPGSMPMPQSASLPRALPGIVEGELLVAELQAGKLMRADPDAASRGSSPCPCNAHRPRARR